MSYNRIFPKNVDNQSLEDLITDIASATPPEFLDGTSAAPSFFFKNEPDKGLYNPIVNHIGMVFGSVGSELQFQGSTNNYVTLDNTDGEEIQFRGNLNQIAFRAGGSTRFFVDLNKIEGFAQYLNIDGTAAAPAFSFTGRPDTGIFYQPNFITAISSNGNKIASFSITRCFFETQVEIGNVTQYKISPVSGLSDTTITAAGNLDVNVTTDYSVAISGQTSILTNSSGYTSSSTGFQQFHRNTGGTITLCQFSSNVSGANTAHFIMSTNGDVLNTNGVYGTISDERLKTGIINARSDYLLDINKLKLKKYKLKKNMNKSLLGLSAQDVELVFPQFVNELDDQVEKDEEGNEFKVKTIKTSLLIYPLISAVQELSKRLEAIESKLV